MTPSDIARSLGLAVYTRFHDTMGPDVHFWELKDASTPDDMSLEGWRKETGSTEDFPYPDFSSLEWQEKIEDRVRELWCRDNENQRRFIEVDYWPSDIILKLKSHEAGKGWSVEFCNPLHMTRSSAWLSALSFLSKEGR